LWGKNTEGGEQVQLKSKQTINDPIQKS